ncbi:MAG TPA: hypothetical protein IAA98_12960 [Candidatus Avipropionibacterium avicola]|uniref:Uncharacterized protein n=1 Tax=Candidatus Avipropionibacterium avicola TaxID=2840701 RepID=A0A9D1KPK3_9ACTN|nr:hypothetical protein [Candidatus Avipropionibacterium avicola]
MHPPQPPAGPPPGPSYQQFPPQGQGPYGFVGQPSRKPRRPWVVALIIIGVVLAVVAGTITTVGVIAYRDWQTRFGAHEPPNADRITAYPTGAAPYAVGPYAIVDGQVAGTLDYSSLSGGRIVFSENERSYWDAMAVGDRWVVVGDLLKDTSTVLEGQYLLAFTDKTLLIQLHEATEDEMLTVLEGFLAVKRGEVVDQDWGETVPPNSADLPAVADSDSSLPKMWGLEPQLERPGDMVLWAGTYESYRSVTAFDLQMWSYFTTGVRYEVVDEQFMCRVTGSLSSCVLAGSDGMVFAQGFSGDESELVKILRSLV